MDLIANNMSILIALAVFYWLEHSFPYYQQTQRTKQEDINNLLVGGFNALLSAAAAGLVFLPLSHWIMANNIGLLQNINRSLFSLVLAILLFDLWQYAWHRLNHTVPQLWKFHQAHHSDASMNTSTAFRFHPVEIFLSSLVRIPVFALLGFTLDLLFLYELLLLPIIIFHHSNWAISKHYDNMLRIILVTPRHHWIHHSENKPETDSNYGSIFSFWDRLFASFSTQVNTKDISRGLGLPDQHWRKLKGGLLLPWRKTEQDNA